MNLLQLWPGLEAGCGYLQARCFARILHNIPGTTCVSGEETCDTLLAGVWITPHERVGYGFSVDGKKSRIDLLSSPDGMNHPPPGRYIGQRAVWAEVQPRPNSRPSVAAGYALGHTDDDLFQLSEVDTSVHLLSSLFP